VPTEGPGLYATSDLHIGYTDNTPWLTQLQPRTNEDWLIVAGDVGETYDQVVDTLADLKERYAEVIWVPGNHELWTVPPKPGELRGVARYDNLVEGLRGIGVITPEDEYPVWDPHGSALTVVPMFLLYDYSWGHNGLTGRAAVDASIADGIVCTDEALLHTDPYDSVVDWCHERVRRTEERLMALPEGSAPVLVNHFPLDRRVLAPLYYPSFSVWCGTELSADWPTRFGAYAVVYGHLHIPIPRVLDGILHQEVSLGYPREWRARRDSPTIPVQIAKARP